MGEKGVLITFEGPNGVGKTLQTQLLKKHLEEAAFPVISVYDPGSALLAEKIRNFLISLPVGFLPPKIECELYYMGRSETLKEIIIPSLKTNKIVISDRFQDSTMVYQGILGGVDFDFLKKMDQKYMFGIQPDLTFLLDAPFSTVESRLEVQKKLNYDPADELNECDYNRIRDAFNTVMTQNNENGRWNLIDTSQRSEVIGDIVFRKTISFIENKLTY